MRSRDIDQEPGSRALRVAVVVEDLLQRVVLAVLSRVGGWRVAVLPFVGHGSPERVHVRARVGVGRAVQEAPRPARQEPAEARPAPQPAKAARPAPQPAEARLAEAQPAEPQPAERAAGTGAAASRAGAAARRGAWWTLGRSLARFLTVELPGAQVTVHLPAGPVEVACDREGYVDIVVERHGLVPGWHDVRLTARWRGRSGAAVARVLVVDPGVRTMVVSDVDDTVIETGLTKGLAFLRLTLLTDVADRTPLPGAAALYRALADGDPGVPVFYLSTSPWNLHDLLLRFVALRGFPAGPLLLTDWGPGRGALFRIPSERHKLTFLRQLLADHPGVGVVLVGDTGQVDPEIYATIAGEAPERVTAVYLRRTDGIPVERAREVARLADSVTAAGVPMLVVEDSVRIAEHAHRIGLLDRFAVDDVRTASTV